MDIRIALRTVRQQWVGVAGAVAVGNLLLLCCSSNKSPLSTPPGYRYQAINVGLTKKESLEFWHTTEGSDLFPVVILQALHDVSTGKPVIESMKDYGLLPSAESKVNPYGLPVGWSTNIPNNRILKVPYVGINCAACHTGQIEYAGKRIRIDGAPNMVDLEKWLVQLVDSIKHTLDDPAEATKFFVRLAKLVVERKEAKLSKNAIVFLDRIADDMEQNRLRGLLPGGPSSVGEEFVEAAKPTEAARPAQALLQRLEARKIQLDNAEMAHATESIEIISPYVAAITDRLKSYVVTLDELGKPPAAGPGRDDAWGIIRNLVYSSPTSLNAPVSIPDLFDTAKVDWYHADGNTRSLLERNVAQGIALGASVDKQTNVRSLVAKNVLYVQELAEKIASPAWPEEVLGAIDQEKAARGKAIYTTRKFGATDGNSYTCLDCHLSHESQFFPLSVAGTDANRANNFLVPVNGKSLAGTIMDTSQPIAKATWAAQGVPFDPRRPDEWQETNKYIPRELDGVWATAPYLHNGSVPTLYHLLLPAAQRPGSFHVGHRAFDPKQVGYEVSVAEPVFTFDTTSDGGSNKGHEFGTGLPDAKRWELVEYMKTL